MRVKSGRRRQNAKGISFTLASKPRVFSAQKNQVVRLAPVITRVRRCQSSYFVLVPCLQFTTHCPSSHFGCLSCSWQASNVHASRSAHVLFPSPDLVTCIRILAHLLLALLAETLNKICLSARHDGVPSVRDLLRESSIFLEPG